MNTPILRDVLFNVVNRARGTTVGLRVRAARSLWQRTVGLLGTKRLPAGEGLWLTPCQSVHTFFMRYPIDVVFLDRENVVIGVETLAPWRFSSWKRQSAGVLELPAGSAAQTGTLLGDRLEWTAV